MPFFSLFAPTFTSKGKLKKNINTFSEWFDVIITFNQAILFLCTQIFLGKYYQRLASCQS